MKIIDVIQKSTEWHNWRKGGISASEIAIILGESPYKTPWWLWAEKVGKIDPADLSNNPFVLTGVLYEPRLRRHLESEYGTILLPICAEYDHNPLFRASLDGFSDVGEPWELKWPSDKMWMEVALFGNNSKPYRLYEPQVQHQMLVTSSNKGYLVFGHETENGIEYKKFEIERDESRINQIMEAGTHFWNLYLNRQAPEKDPSIDFFEPDVVDHDKWRALATRARSLDNKLKPLKEEVNRLKLLQDEVKSETTAMMGNFAKGSFDDLNVTQTLRMGNIDYQSYLKEKGILDEEALEEYRKQGSFVTRLTLSKNSSNKTREVDECTPLIGLIASSDTDFF